MNSLLRFPIALVAAFLGVFWAPAAFAQAPSSQEETLRASLVVRAQAAHAAGNHKEALELATRASEIQLTPSLRYLLAYEQDELGLFAEAYGNAHECAREFERDAKLPKRELFLNYCKALRDRLDVKVGRVVVKVTKAHDGLVVKVGGREVKPAFFGEPYPFTPGTLPVEAWAPGYATYRRDIAVAAGAAPFELLIPPLVAEAAPAVANVACPPGFIREGANCVFAEGRREDVGGSGALASGGGTADLSASADTGFPRHRVLGTALAIAGAAVAVAGGVSYLVAGSKLESAKDDCAQKGCSVLEAYESQKTVRSYDRWAAIGGLAGAALVAAGTTVFFVGGRF